MDPGDRPVSSGAGPAPPRYIDALIGDFASGRSGRFNHLGHWSDPVRDPLATGFGQAQLHMVEILSRLGGIGDGDRVLDVGSGFGGVLELLDQRFRDVVLVGLDIDGRQLALCRSLVARPGNHIGWLQGDGCVLPVATGSVDRIVTIEAMWHFPSRRAFLAEAARVLRPGGSLVAVDLLVRPGSAAEVGLLDDAAVAERLREAFAPWPVPHLTVEDLVAMGRDAGLACTEVVDATQATKPTYLDHGDSADRPGASGFSSSRAVELFVDLHQRDLLSVLYLRFDLDGPAR